MKFCTWIPLLFTSTCASTVAAATSNSASNIRTISSKNSNNLSPSATRTLIQRARRVDQNNNNGDTGESFLQLYSLKLIECLSNQQVVDKDTGEVESSLVIFRLCPVDSCSSSSTGGCESSANSADYAVGLSTFVQAYLQDLSDNMDGDEAADDEFPLEEYAQCAQYQGDDDNGSYYLGPMCSDNQLDITIGVYSDQYCSEQSEASFADISGGWSLPYGTNGGMVSTNCIPCAEWNGDDDANHDGDEYELRELCYEMYQSANYRCEASDYASHYYWDAITEVNRFGQDTTGCNNINGWELKRKKSKTNWGEVFFLLVLVTGSVAGGVYYTVWWKEQKEGLELIDDDNDDETMGDDHTTDTGDVDKSTREIDIDKQVADSQQHVPMHDAAFT